MTGLGERLLSRMLLVVTGKGGVGKSTVTAALGRLAARAGKRTLLLEADPRESLYPLLEIEPSGGDEVDAGEGLFVQNVRPKTVLDRLVGERLKIGFLTRRVTASPVYEHFIEGAPGLKEMALLGHAYTRIREAPYDLVLVDAPATGHGLSLLAAPKLVSTAIDHGPVGELAGELSRFVEDPERCGALLVAVAEEMPVQESLELIASMRERLARRPELVVLNALVPGAAEADVADGAVGAVGADGSDPAVDADPLLALWRRRAAVQRRERARLARGWDGPRVDLPHLALDTGAALVEALAPRLAEGLR